MAIYRKGEDQFGLHESAMEQDSHLNSDEHFNGQYIANATDRDGKHITVKTLEDINNKFGESTPISGAGLAYGKRKKKK